MNRSQENPPLKSVDEQLALIRRGVAQIEPEAELRQKLEQHRPATIAQAQAIEGMTPAAATLLLAIIRRGALRKAG